MQPNDIMGKVQLPVLCSHFILQFNKPKCNFEQAYILGNIFCNIAKYCILQVVPKKDTTEPSMQHSGHLYSVKMKLFNGRVSDS